MRKESEISMSSPKAPDVLTFINRKRLESFRNEKQVSGNKEAMQERCGKRIELCNMLEKIEPDNPTWRYAKEFFTTFPEGEEAIWNLINKWSVFSDPSRDLTPPKGMQDVHPAEFMDLNPDASQKLASNSNMSEEEKGTFLQLASDAHEASLNQYDILKYSVLTPPGKNSVPLLCADYIKTIVDVDPNAPKCLIGLSYDEAEAYRIISQQNNKGKETSALLGVFRYASSTMEQAIKDGQITEISIRKGETIKSSNLKPGEIYAAFHDVSQGIPIEANEFVLGTLYSWHHFPNNEKGALLKEMVDLSKKLGDDKNKPAVAIFEPINSKNLLSMVIKVNGPNHLGHETAAFDAILGTTICGAQTPKEFVQEAKKYSPNTNWSAKIYPNLPDIKFVQKNILPYQQVGLTGW